MHDTPTHRPMTTLPGDLAAIAALVPWGARVLDLGCGPGHLLSHLLRQKNCSGYGVELDDANLLACVKQGLPVLQRDLEEGLQMFADQSFDVVLQLQTLQSLRNVEAMLREIARVGRTGIVSFPNFAHWPHRLSVLSGRMPVSKSLPYEWYDTPNIRVGTYADFGRLATRNGLKITDAFGLHQGRVIRHGINWRASLAVFKLTLA